jgi:hypothetical protein
MTGLRRGARGDSHTVRWSGAFEKFQVTPRKPAKEHIP